MKPNSSFRLGAAWPTDCWSILGSGLSTARRITSVASTEMLLSPTPFQPGGGDALLLQCREPAVKVGTRDAVWKRHGWAATEMQEARVPVCQSGRELVNSDLVRTPSLDNIRLSPRRDRSILLDFGGSQETVVNIR
jgi:hypothetical protein